MNKKTELKKLAKQIFPSTDYPWKERKIYRNNLYNEMLSFWDNHPEYSLDDVVHTYCDKENLSDFPAVQNPTRFIRPTLILLGIILLMGFVMILISSSWNAPTIHL